MILKKDEVTLLPLGIYFDHISSLFISDLHIGFEKALQKQGIQMPKSSYPEIKERSREYIEMVKPQNIILVGDIKEDFGEFNFQEFYELKDYFEFLKDLNINIEVIRGNHDNYLLPFLKKMEINYHEKFLIMGDTFITHGHLNLEEEIRNSKAKRIVFGHEHPSIMVRDSSGLNTKFKATIIGDVYSRTLYSLPAFSPLKPGTEINVADKKDFLSPIFKDADLDSCVAHLFEEDEWFSFPIRDIRIKEPSFLSG